jgi:HEAT repeat protein
MKIMTKRNFIIALMLGVFSLTSTTLSAADKKLLTEDELIAELAGPNEDKVANAMVQLEKRFPTGTKALPTIKKLLTDPREKVRRKAVRVLGVLHAEVDATDLKNITAMFKAANPLEVIDALKGLSGLKAESTIPEILPLLQNPTRNVVRDAIRAIASLGNKSHIPSIEPLLKHADAAVQKDAKDAIFALQKK